MLERVTVLLCRVGEVAEIIEIENSDEGVAELLGCDVSDLSYIMPWSQDVRVIFKDSVQEIGCVNRFLHRERGEGGYTICGDFIVALMPRGCSSFLNIPRLVVDRYKKLMEVL